MNRRCHGPPLKDKLITTVGQQGKQNLMANTMVLLNWLLPAAEQKPLIHSHPWADIILNIPVLKYPSFILWFAHGVCSPFLFNVIV